MSTTIIPSLPHDPPDWVRDGEPVDGEPLAGAIQPESIQARTNRPTAQVQMNLEEVVLKINDRCQQRYDVDDAVQTVQEWYVDDISGSDTTGDGLTSSTPVKTLGKVFDLIRSDVSGAIFIYLKEGTGSGPNPVRTYAWPAGTYALMQFAYCQINTYTGESTPPATHRDNTIIDMSDLEFDPTDYAKSTSPRGGFTFLAGTTIIANMTIKSPYVNRAGDLGAGQRSAGPILAVRSGYVQLYNVALIAGDNVNNGNLILSSPVDPTGDEISALASVYGGSLVLNGQTSVLGEGCIVDGTSTGGAPHSVGFSIAGQGSITVSNTHLHHLGVIFTDLCSSFQGGGSVILGPGVYLNDTGDGLVSSDLFTPAVGHKGAVQVGTDSDVNYVYRLRAGTGLSGNQIADTLVQHNMPDVFRLETANATPVETLVLAPPTNTTMTVRYRIVGRRTDGGGVGNTGSYDLVGTFKNIAGTLTQVGATAVLATVEDTAGWAAAFSINTTRIGVTVTGAAAETIDWTIERLQ